MKSFICAAARKHIKTALSLLLAVILMVTFAGISASAAEIKVQLDTYEGAESITLDVALTDSVESVKAKIAAETGTPVRNQTLVFGEKTLVNGTTLKDYSVTASSTLTLYRNYTVTFVADGKVVSTKTVAHGNDAELPEIPEKAGHTSVEPVWNNDGRYITADTTITAIYTSNGYTVTVPAEQAGYTLQAESHLVPRGSDVVLSFTTAIGYEKGENFAVKVNGAKVTVDEGGTIITRANKNLVFTVEGVVKKIYTINFVADGETVESATYAHGDAVTMPTLPEKEGYTGKWGTTVETATSDATVYAVYTPISSQEENSPENSWWIILVAAVVVLAIGGAVFFIKKSKAKPQEENKKVNKKKSK